MPVISFANQKGGVGKTSSVFEISYILSKKDQVLMIDLDSQRNLTEICGIDSTDSKTVYDAIMGNVSFKEAIVPVRENLDLLCGSRKMLSQYFVGIDDVYALKEALEFIEQYKKYDYIFIDVGPEAGQLMSMALIASDYVIAVTSLAKLGYSGVVQMCADINRGKKHFANFNVKPLGILINSVKKTNVSSLNRDKFNELSEVFGAPAFKTEIKNSCIMDECKEAGLALNEYKPSSELSRQFYRVAEEIKERIR